MRSRFAPLSFLWILVLSSEPAWAYIDPGTGATLIGSLGPLALALAVAVALLLLKLLWKPMRRRFLGKRDGDELD